MFLPRLDRFFRERRETEGKTRSNPGRHAKCNVKEARNITSNRVSLRGLLLLMVWDRLVWFSLPPVSSSDDCVSFSPYPRKSSPSLCLCSLSACAALCDCAPPSKTGTHTFFSSLPFLSAFCFCYFCRFGMSFLFLGFNWLPGFCSFDIFSFSTSSQTLFQSLVQLTFWRVAFTCQSFGWFTDWLIGCGIGDFWLSLSPVKTAVCFPSNHAPGTGRGWIRPISHPSAQIQVYHSSPC